MRRLPFPRHALVLTLATLLLVGSAVPALAAEIVLDDDGFSPRMVDVEVGQSIVWVNRTDEVQTVVGEDGTWDSGPLRPGETFSVAFRDAGTFRYAAAEGDVVGTVRVTEAAEVEDATEDEAAEAAEAEEVALPTTGIPSPVLLGWALVLVGAGSLCLQRAARLVR